jgi:excisionase family DNA binding protein
MNIIENLEATDHAMTATELAELLQCHPVTIQRWARRGSLPSYRLGGDSGAGEWRFDPREVITFLKKHSRMNGGK